MAHVNEPHAAPFDGAEERLEVPRQSEDGPDAWRSTALAIKSAPSMLQEVRSITDQTPVGMRATTRRPDFASMRNEDFVSYKISVLSRIRTDGGVDKKLLSGFDLPLTASRLLGHLHAHGEGRILAIARTMHMLGSQVSQSMMELVTNELVVRSPDPSDKRGAIFRLSAKGRTLYEGVLAKAIAKQRKVAALIGAENYRTMSECLDILIAHYGAEDGANGR